MGKLLQFKLKTNKTIIDQNKQNIDFDCRVKRIYASLKRINELMAEIKNKG